MRFECFVTLLFTIIGFTTANEQPETLSSFINSVKNANGTVWAVLVATGNEYIDYRFHAGLLFTLHLLVAKGVPENQIITMMNDNFINSAQNPFPGKIYGYPGGSDNIYRFVNIDYNGNEVTGNNFLNILKSNSENGKKVLESTQNDGVIVYYTGYGGFRMLVFPENDIVYDEDLVNAVSLMTQRNTYKKMMFVVDSSMSGSLFFDFSQFTEVQVQTSTDWRSDSYVTFYNPIMRIFMANDFSIRWLLSSGLNVASTYQILWLLDNVTPVKQNNSVLFAMRKWHKAEQSSHTLAFLRFIEREQQYRKRILRGIIAQIDSSSSFLKNIELPNRDPVDINCYKDLVQTFQHQCRNRVITYGHATLMDMYKFANLCQVSGQRNAIKRAIAEECRRIF